MKIAIIPARGGSKRLPGKNIKKLAGKPLIAWTIEAALNSNIFNHVFVSTDCQDIAAVATKYGAEVPFIRPAELASDEASTNDVVTHLVEWFEKESGENTTIIAILQPTSPLRNAQHIQQAVQLFKEKSANAIISVCELEHPIQLCNKLGENDSMLGFVKQENLQRSQDLETHYRLNGAIYLFKRKYVGKLNELYNEGTYAFRMSSCDSIDIDTQYDFELANFIFNL